MRRPWLVPRGTEPEHERAPVTLVGLCRPNPMCRLTSQADLRGSNEIKC